MIIVFDLAKMLRSGARKAHFNSDSGGTRTWTRHDVKKINKKQINKKLRKKAKQEIKRSD